MLPHPTIPNPFQVSLITTNSTGTGTVAPLRKIHRHHHHHAHARRIIAHLHHLIAMLNSRSLLRIIDSWRFDIIMTVWWGAAAVRDLIIVSLVCGGIEMQQAHFGPCSKQSL